MKLKPFGYFQILVYFLLATSVYVKVFSGAKDFDLLLIPTFALAVFFIFFINLAFFYASSKVMNWKIKLGFYLTYILVIGFLLSTIFHLVDSSFEGYVFSFVPWLAQFVLAFLIVPNKEIFHSK